MKIRESGMPELERWESFFDTGKILAQLTPESGVQDVVEFGCGYGTFTLPMARLASGTVYALDLDTEMITATRRRAASESLANIAFLQRDFVTEGSGLDDGAADYAMLFNILHCEKPVALLREARRNLGAGGTVGVIHWAHNRETPRGPPMHMRPSPDQCRAWAEQAGLESCSDDIALPPYHFGVIFRRTP